MKMTKKLIRKPVAKEIEPVFGFKTENRISSFWFTSLIYNPNQLQIYGIISP